MIKYLFPLLFLLPSKVHEVSFYVPPTPYIPAQVGVNMPIDVIVNDSTLFVVIYPKDMRIIFPNGTTRGIDSILFVEKYYEGEDTTNVWEDWWNNE
jgi:hypothetical protein